MGNGLGVQDWVDWIMEKDFWLERWDRGEIGFHQGEINPHLLRHWHELSAASGSEVFVPLCGKTRDMLWLREQGHPVLGVELSPLAVQAFFEENGYTPKCFSTPKFGHCAADNIHILCGDFFDLTGDDLKGVTAVYDRASLVALPPEMRARYVTHLLNILPPAPKILLIAFDYQQSEMPGPPFAVSRAEVESLYGGRAHVRLLAQHDTLAENPRFQQRGISRLEETVFLVTVN